MSNYTPIIKQYIDIKKKHKDKIIFFRIGDFYEIFFDDAIECANILMLYLTNKNKTIPMCGFPAHNLEIYIIKLLKYGKKIGICEQIGLTKFNGLIKRKLTLILTPGTFVADNYLQNNKNNYISCVYCKKKNYNIAFLDVCSGEFTIKRLTTYKDLKNEIDKVDPIEILTNKSNLISDKNKYVKKIQFKKFKYINLFKKIKNLLNKKSTIKNFLYFKNGIKAGIRLIKYLLNMQNYNLKNISYILLTENSKNLHIDITTRKNLEILKNNTDTNKNYLFNIIDNTQTCSGKKLLKSWILSPLVAPNIELENRTIATEILKNNLQKNLKLKNYLKNINNIEKILYNLNKNSAKPIDLKNLEKSLIIFMLIKKELIPYKNITLLNTIFKNIIILKNLIKIIKKSIKNKTSNNIKDGNIIKINFDKKIDYYKNKIKNIDKIILNYENFEKNKIKIKNLKIINGKDGYYIELNKNISPPKNFIKIKELKNSIKYTTKKLKNIELNILSYHNKLLNRELKVYEIICYIIKKQTKNIKTSLNNISILDVIRSFAETAYKNTWCKPIYINKSIIYIKNGRHPTVELNKKNNFIANNTYLNKKNKTYIITGPNMGGKSTYMRQIAIITLLAHIGSHIPAEKLIIGKIDKIFTRIGANDDISNSLSTFMLEMTELATILKNSTSKSLVIIDEIGRGTSYKEGLSIALAVLTEFILKKKSFLLFSTHFNEVACISKLYDNVKSIFFKVILNKKKLLFLYKYFNGISKKDFASKVANMAGISSKITNMANYYLFKLKYNNNTKLLNIIKNLKKENYILKKKIILIHNILKK